MSSILNAVTGVAGGLLSMIPGGSLVSSIIGGAGKLLLGKAAAIAGIPGDTISKLSDAIVSVSNNDPEVQQAIAKEEEERRKFELEFFGRAADLSPKAQFWRAFTRPILTITLVGLFALGTITQMVQGVLGYTPLTMTPELVELVKWVAAFWFTGRSVEKLIGSFTGK